MNKSLLSISLAVIYLLASCTGRSTPVPSPTATIPPTLTATPAPTFTPTPPPTVPSTAEPAWFAQLDASYSSMKYRYGLVEDPRAKAYVSLEDAAAGNGNYGRMSEAPTYIYINGEQILDGKTWYGSLAGWISEDDVQLVTPSSLRGIRLTRPVDFRYGWVLQETISTNAAGETIRTYSRYELIHEVPAVTEHAGFFAVGPDEWLPLEALAVTSSALPTDIPAGMCRFIYVDLTAQTMRVFDACQVVFAGLVSTGEDPRWTWPGGYALLNKYEYAKLTQPIGSISTYSLLGVPYFMPYAGDWGFHAAYWHDSFGAPVSHGCVNLSPADAKWLYEWAYIGERVIIARP